MSTPNPVVTVTAAAAPWYTSKVQIAQVVTLISAFAAISPKVAATLGLTSLENIQTTVEAIFGTIAFLAPIVGSFLRARSKLQPLTLTQAKADAHPATIATLTTAVQVSAPPPSIAPVAPGVTHVQSVPSPFLDVPFAGTAKPSSPPPAAAVGGSAPPPKPAA